MTLLKKCIKISNNLLATLAFVFLMLWNCIKTHKKVDLNKIIKKTNDNNFSFHFKMQFFFVGCVFLLQFQKCVTLKHFYQLFNSIYYSCYFFYIISLLILFAIFPIIPIIQCNNAHMNWLCFRPTLTFRIGKNNCCDWRKVYQENC